MSIVSFGDVPRELLAVVRYRGWEQSRESRIRVLNDMLQMSREVGDGDKSVCLERQLLRILETMNKRDRPQSDVRSFLKHNASLAHMYANLQRAISEVQRNEGEWALLATEQYMNDLEAICEPDRRRLMQVAEQRLAAANAILSIRGVRPTIDLNQDDTTP